MAEMGEVFNLGEVLLNAERIKSMRSDQGMREQIMEERRAEAALKKQQLQQSDDEKAMQFQLPMMKAIAEKGRSLGLQGDEAEQWAREQQIVYGGLLSKLSNNRYAWKPHSYGEMQALDEMEPDPEQQKLRMYRAQKQIDAEFAPKPETTEQKLDLFKQQEGIRAENQMRVEQAKLGSQQNSPESISKRQEVQRKQEELQLQKQEALATIDDTMKLFRDSADLQEKVGWRTGPVVANAVTAPINKALPGGGDVQQLEANYAKLAFNALQAFKSSGGGGALSDAEGQWIKSTTAALNKDGKVNLELLKNGLTLLGQRKARLMGMPTGWKFLPNGRLQGPDGREYQR